MKYNGLSILGVLMFALFIFFSPINVFAQDTDSKAETAKFLEISSTEIKIKNYINKYIEVKLTNGKKVTGKLVEYKNDSLLLKEGLLKKQISIADVVSFEIVKSPEEKFKEGLEKFGEEAMNIAAIPIYLPLFATEKLLNQFDLTLLAD